MAAVLRRVAGAIPERVLEQAKRWRYTRSVPQYAHPDAIVARELVQAGDTVVDVGANVGWYTHLFSRAVGPTGHVYSIEPVPPTFEILSHVVGKLHLDNVTLLNVAISDRDGRASMQVPLGRRGMHNYYRAAITAEPDTAPGMIAYDVATRTLDDVIADRTVGFVKWDVEGHELASVSGARALLHRHRPALLIEVSGDLEEDDSAAAQLRRMLEGLDYSMYWVDGSVIRPWQEGTKSVNYFFLQEAHIPMISSRLVHGIAEYDHLTPECVDNKPSAEPRLNASDQLLREDPNL